MTNYEAIKNMSEEEIAAVFYMFMKPAIEVLAIGEKDRQVIRETIKTFLSREKAGQNENPV